MRMQTGYRIGIIGDQIADMYTNIRMLQSVQDALNRCVTLSSMWAGYVALTETCQECILIRHLLGDFLFKKPETTIVYIDNQSCLNLMNRIRFSHRTKHIETKIIVGKLQVFRSTVKLSYFFFSFLNFELEIASHLLFEEVGGSSTYFF